jgi:methoxymalonate biosynthesis acyl carrier protein
MSAEQISADDIEREIAQFVAGRVNEEVPADRDLFTSGLVSSMFAMELVVYLEQTFEIEILGNDLKRDNFRSIQAMTGLVLRLRHSGDRADV